MTSVKDILENIPEATNDGVSVEDIMQNPEYLRQSSTVISEALQKGFDVLQLENGDIVTTGTKVIVTQFHFDPALGKMVKLSAKDRKQFENN
jgi:hypothetical protein